MKINRQELLSAIEAVTPALASKEMIEELVHVWFSGKYVSAYNDASLGMRAPVDCELIGGVRGKLITGILRHSRAKEFEVELLEDGNAKLKAGKTIFSLALLPQERNPWHLPKLGKAEPIKGSQELLGGLRAVKTSIGTGTTRPEQLGVTFIRDGDYLNLFATDSHSLSKATMEMPEHWPKIDRVIWPTPFIDQILKLKDINELEIWVRENEVIAHYAGLMIYSRTVACKKPLDFQKMEDENETDKVTPIPKRLRLALERACTLLEGQPNEKLEVEAQGEELKFTAKTPRGNLSDRIKFDKPITSKDCFIRPDLMLRALPLCETMAFAPRSIVLESPGFKYWLAAT